MKKMITILLAVLLIASVMIFVAQAASGTNEPTQTSTLETIEDPTLDIERPTLGDVVVTPDDMPTKPEYDYSVPPVEKPTAPDKVTFE